MVDKQIYFSAVIPLYNKEKSIANTINSVLDQTNPNFELIIVNDGSTDGSLEVVQSFNDDRIKIIDKENGGVSSARNRGIKEAKHEWIAFLDGDDLWETNHLTTIANLMNKYSQGYVFVSNFYRRFSDKKQELNRDDLTEGVIDNYFKAARKKAIINSSCVTISKHALIGVGMFDERLNRGEDINLWCKLARKYQVVYTPKATSIYILEAESNSSSFIPIPESTGTYHICLEECVNRDDYLFQIKRIIRLSLAYLLKHRKIKYFLKMIKRYK